MLVELVRQLSWIAMFALNNSFSDHLLLKGKIYVLKAIRTLVAGDSEEPISTHTDESIDVDVDARSIVFTR